MTIQAPNGQVIVPMGGLNGFSQVNTVTTIDAAEEASILVGQVWTADGGSHTIDTTGSSAIDWLTGAVTFANAGTTVKVGLAAIDGTAQPPRAANAANVITFDVSKSLTGGGGGITGSAWQSHVPDAGTKTIANGDFVAFCVQMTARGGADSVIVAGCLPETSNPYALPSSTSYTGAAYAQANRVASCHIVFSDGTLGFFVGAPSFSTVTTNSFNNASATREAGNLFSLPYPAKIYGIRTMSASLGASGASVDFLLYSDPLGTPAAEKTTSVDSDYCPNATNRHTVLFASPFSATANTTYAIALKPTTATNVVMTYATHDATNHLGALPLGTSMYAATRGSSGAFTAQNSSKDRYALELLVGAFDDATSTGGAFAFGSVF